MYDFLFVPLFSPCPVREVGDMIIVAGKKSGSISMRSFYTVATCSLAQTLSLF